ncbi:MAG: PhaM family polyhydroxyalkanoate granule multifunctional regulatory protein [Candidatus Levyibacteriota bacterium]
MSDDSTRDTGAAKPFSAEDAMAFMQRMWNPFAMPMPVAGAAPAASQGGPGQGAAATAPPGVMPGMMGGFMPGVMPFPNPAAMFAALDPAEVDRKIGELRVIEGWLAMTLNLMQMSIKTLELQRASLEALQPAHAPEPAKHKGEAKSRKA